MSTAVDLVTAALVGLDAGVRMRLLLVLLLGEVKSKGRNHFEQKLASHRGIVLFPRSDVSPTIPSPIMRPEMADTCVRVR